VEGLELLVLEGLRGLIAKWRPDIYIEVIDGNLAEFSSFVGSVEYRVIKTFKTYDHLKNYHLRAVEKIVCQ
jgi:hypothetical protein